MIARWRSWSWRLRGSDWKKKMGLSPRPLLRLYRGCSSR